MESFILNIHSGRWDIVLSQVSNFQLPKEKLIMLYEQVALELIEAREIDLAKEVYFPLF